MRILANSPGWKLKLPMPTHSLEPYFSVPTSMGSSRRATPTMPSVYLYSASLSRLRTTNSTPTMAATERKSQMTWLTA